MRFLMSAGASAPILLLAPTCLKGTFWGCSKSGQGLAVPPPITGAGWSRAWFADVPGLSSPGCFGKIPGWITVLTRASPFARPAPWPEAPLSTYGSSSPQKYRGEKTPALCPGFCGTLLRFLAPCTTLRAELRQGKDAGCRSASVMD